MISSTYRLPNNLFTYLKKTDLAAKGCMTVSVLALGASIQIALPSPAFPSEDGRVMGVEARRNTQDEDSKYMVGPCDFGGSVYWRMKNCPP